jgi:hypothetical protein
MLSGGGKSMVVRAHSTIDDFLQYASSSLLRGFDDFLFDGHAIPAASFIHITRLSR